MRHYTPFKSPLEKCNPYSRCRFQLLFRSRATMRPKDHRRHRKADRVARSQWSGRSPSTSHSQRMEGDSVDPAKGGKGPTRRQGLDRASSHRRRSAGPRRAEARAPGRPAATRPRWRNILPSRQAPQARRYGLWNIRPRSRRARSGIPNDRAAPSALGSPPLHSWIIRSSSIFTASSRAMRC